MSDSGDKNKEEKSGKKEEDEKKAAVKKTYFLSALKRELEKQGVKTSSSTLSSTLHDAEDKVMNPDKHEDAKNETVNPNSLINTSYIFNKLKMALDEKQSGMKKEVEPVVKSKRMIKIKLKKRSEVSTLKAVMEKDQFESGSSTSNDDVILTTPSHSMDFDEAQVEPTLEKLKTVLEEKYLNAPPTETEKVDVPKGGAAVNFGPFSPKPLRFKIIYKKPPKSKLLLEPPRRTYLRVRARTRSTSNADDPAPSTMGPPKPRVCKTPYKRVKEALTFLKNELGIADQSRAEAEHETDDKVTEYSLSKVSPMSLLSVEEVIMELGSYLKSMSEDISSDEMKARLSAFQSKLGLPDWPQFYSLIYTSPMDLMHFLSVNGFEYDADVIGSDSEEEEEEEEEAVDDGEAAVNEDVESADDANATIGEGRYKSLPMPRLSHYDALEIVHTFVNRLSEGMEMNEDDFLRLQYDLHIPGWIELYDMYQKESMQEVINYIDGYFAHSRVASKKR